MITHDLHIHTHLSDCADRQAFMSDYIARAKELGLTTVGFADHAWDDKIDGASGWYQKQPFSRLATRKQELDGIDTSDIDIRFGAEGEYASFLLGMSESVFEYIDYVIVPHSHTHMTGFVLPEDCKGDPEKHAKYLVDSFISLCRHKMSDRFFGIAHPMSPVGKNAEQTEEIFGFITDAMLNECACAAKESGIPLEANLSILKNIPPDANQSFCLHRFFDACKRAGCKFFLGSDAHNVASLTRHTESDVLLSYIGLSDDDFVIL